MRTALLVLFLVAAPALSRAAENTLGADEEREARELLDAWVDNDETEYMYELRIEGLGGDAETFDFQEEGCGPPDPCRGKLAVGGKSSFSCSSGDCGAGAGIERDAKGLKVMYGRGCSVGDESSDSVEERGAFTLPASATVTLECEEK